MKFTNESINLENGIKKEWILTNGMGGYSSSTIIGANTRKYHGLLVAPLDPPGRRFVLLSKLDESLVLNNENYSLTTNMCPNYISEGFKNQVSFEKGATAKFEYQIKDVNIKKEICLVYGENTVCIKYIVKTGDQMGRFVIAPIMNFRDFHSMTTNQEFQLRQNVVNNKIKIIINNNIETPIYLKFNDSQYIEHYNDTFRNMYYMEEEKRGFYPLENLSVPGRFEVMLPSNTTKTLEFICSLNENIDEIKIDDVIKNEEKRINKVVKDALGKEINNESSLLEQKRNELKELLVKATDNFIVYRPKFGLHTVIAGYPWFLDWGRDALISFEGLFLLTKRYDLAKELFLTGVRDMKYGLLPNGYSGFDNRPLYNSVDASLLMFEQVHKYIRYTGDYKFVKQNLYDKLVRIIHSYEEGIDVDNNNIYLDKDGLLVSGTDQTQNTWMDAKIGNYVVTPRNGKAVEINALWYNALKVLEALASEFEDEKEIKYAQKLSKKCKASFKEKFYNSKKKCLFDVLGDLKVRPNQIFALALSYQILDPSSEIAKNVFNTVTKKLLKAHGLKTLAKGEENYVETYEGDGFRRDMSYHQGPTWVWLLGMYNDAYKNIINASKNKDEKEELEVEYKKFVENVITTFHKEVTQGKCVGQIAEIYDSKAPYEAKGTTAQAWSVAEVLRVIF